MKNRLTAMLLIIMLLTAFCYRTAAASEKVSQKGTAETASEAFLKEDSPEARMAGDLVGYVCVSETLYKNVLWVLDVFDQFDKDRKWENLQLARAALSIARLNNAALQFPEMKMAVSDYTALMDRGVDVSFLEDGQESFEDDQTYYKNSCINLQYAIMDDVFIEEDWLLRRERGTIYRDMIESEMQYLANTVDWVLSSLGDDGISANLYDLMEKNCPLTRAKQASVLKSPEKIEDETAVLRNHIKALRNDRSEVNGAHRHRQNVLKEYLEKGDYAAIGAGLMEISGLPLVIPYPAWYGEQIDYYYWKENGEVTELPAPGTVLERIPDTFLTKSSGVTREDVLEYQEELEEAGLTCSGSTNKNGKLFILYKYGESVFSIIWENDEARIFMTENPICFAPFWYLPAKNAVN